MAWGLGGKLVMQIYVVRCKRCLRDIPAKRHTFPGQMENTVVQCCLCGEKRRYRPTEVFLGHPHLLVKRV